MRLRALFSSLLFTHVCYSLSKQCVTAVFMDSGHTEWLDVSNKCELIEYQEKEHPVETVYMPPECDCLLYLDDECRKESNTTGGSIIGSDSWNDLSRLSSEEWTQDGDRVKSYICMLSEDAWWHVSPLATTQQRKDSERK
ncbi:hypothetical protein BDV95DRAFT_82305 [Massariosphaeria phaeospora]|uniref:Uncharacterized protein n=1 Tax=Massariosphaeria phaeospora TaxID=100035 RepID=A0A7C8M400_9PLEO|nr:hypothetical protein BDV95DRAFT_82305 [Massariosphaeria phaeospora]